MIDLELIMISSILSHILEYVLINIILCYFSKNSFFFGCVVIVYSWKEHYKQITNNKRLSKINHYFYFHFFP